MFSPSRSAVDVALVVRVLTTDTTSADDTLALGTPAIEFVGTFFRSDGTEYAVGADGERSFDPNQHGDASRPDEGYAPMQQPVIRKLIQESMEFLRRYETLAKDHSVPHNNMMLLPMGGTLVAYHNGKSRLRMLGRMIQQVIQGAFNELYRRDLRGQRDTTRAGTLVTGCEKTGRRGASQRIKT